LAEAFDRLDCDDSGYISAENLQALLGDEFPPEEIAAIIEVSLWCDKTSMSYPYNAQCLFFSQEADLERDNKISYSEFLALWGDRHEEKRKGLYEDFRQDSFFDSTHERSTTHIIEEAKLLDMKKGMRDDSSHDNSMLGRENYLEGKKKSERRIDDILALDQEEAKKIMYDEVGAVIEDAGEDREDPAEEVPVPGASKENQAPVVYADV
jgi:hypothetical protein